MLIFDAMAREVCTSRRISTNTPLQALVTLNDSVFVETSVHFAKRMIEQPGTIEDKISYGYNLMMSDSISSAKLDILVGLYNNLNEEDLIKNVANSNNAKKQDVLARSMLVLANTMLNLDEFLMKN